MLPAIGALLIICATSSSAGERRITVVVEAQDAMKAPVLARLRHAFQQSPAFTIHEFDRAAMADPIEKGRLLAGLQNSDLLVAVGNPAAELVLNELEDVAVYFVGGSLISGDQLASPSVMGVLSYNIEGLLDAAGRLWSGTLGMAYTPGYETIAASVREGARSRGFAVLEKKISTRKDIPPAIKELLDRCQLLWIAGDPLLARGAGFQFLVEHSLSKQVPIVAAGAWEVQRGAFLSIDPPADALASDAAAAIKVLANGGENLDSARIRMAPPGGTVVYNGPLADKWATRQPVGRAWRNLP